MYLKNFSKKIHLDLDICDFRCYLIYNTNLTKGVKKMTLTNWHNNVFPAWMNFDRFDNFFEDHLTHYTPALRQSHTLDRERYRWDENENEYKIDFLMPGLTKKDVDVTFKEGKLHIKCKKEVSEKDKNFFGVRTEQTFGNFPSSVNASNISAEMVDGILSVTLPKRESDKPKVIEIK